MSQTVSLQEANRINDLDGKTWTKLTKSWFIINPKPRTERELTHPAKFPIEIPRRFIRLFSRKQQTVFDPFCGCGTTLYAARGLGRNGIGIELNEGWVEYIRTQLTQTTLIEPVWQEVIHGDARELTSLLNSHFAGNIPQLDLCITSPPYWKILRDSGTGRCDTQAKDRIATGLPTDYGDDPRNLELVDDYQEFLYGLVAIFRQIHKLLRDRGFLVIIVQNLRNTEDKQVYPLAWHLGLALGRFFELKREQLWCQANKSVGLHGFPTSYISNVHHHYCLIFQKTK